jgi:hypothetical protein
MPPWSEENESSNGNDTGVAACADATAPDDVTAESSATIRNLVPRVMRLEVRVPPTGVLPPDG